MHTCRSDGIESPAVVASWYRRAGYDFLAITDHHRYAPSLEAIRAFDGVPIDLALLPGEEVHPPENNIHIINFGGRFSVNELHQQHTDDYRRDVAEIQSALSLPRGVRAYDVASALWVFRKVKEAGGVSILCHPNWTWNGAYNLPAQTYTYFLEHIGYDVLELINGGNFPHENQLQVAAWYNSGAPERRPHVVGADDSHGSVNGKWFDIGKTFALAVSNTREDVLESLRSGRCCAVEQYHEEGARIYGSLRLVRYFTFLQDEYFPLHDELCVEEGRLMLEYADGREYAKERLTACSGQTDQLYRHLFGLT